MSSNVQDTSKQAFHDLTDLGPKQQVIFAILSYHGPKTDKQLMTLTGWPISSVTARRNELCKRGMVRQMPEKVTDPETGCTVNLWTVTQ